jgi:hypothetical protein
VGENTGVFNMKSVSSSGLHRSVGFAPVCRLAIVAVCLSAVVAVPLLAGTPPERGTAERAEPAMTVAALPTRRAKPAAPLRPAIEIEKNRSAVAWLQD